MGKKPTESTIAKDEKGNAKVPNKENKIAPVFKPYVPFDFSTLNLNDIEPNNTELWTPLMGFTYKEIFCFVNSELVCCKPTAAQLKDEPSLGAMSKVMPMSYWAVGIFVPELECYFFQYQNVVFSPGKLIESEIVTNWVYTRGELHDELHNFIDLYEEHNRLPLSINDKLGPRPKLTAFYYILLEVISSVRELFTKKFVEDGWPQLQKDYFAKTGKGNAKVSNKHKNTK